MVNFSLEYHRFWSVIGCEFNQVEHKCETGNRFHGFVSQVNFYSRQLDFNLDIPQIRLDPQKVFDPFSNVLLLWNEYLFETSDRIIPSEADERPCPGRCRTYSGIDFFAFWVILNAIFLPLSRILTGFSNRLDPDQGQKKTQRLVVLLFQTTIVICNVYLTIHQFLLLKPKQLI